jgi:hypothetical protein
MDKTMLDKFMNEILTLLQTAKDFAVTQMPEVCEEVLRYNLYNSIFCVVANLLGLIGCYLFARWLHKKAVAEDNDYFHVFSFFTAIGAIFSLGMLLSSLMNAFKITMAPRLYLIEYFSYLISHK